MDLFSVQITYALTIKLLPADEIVLTHLIDRTAHLVKHDAILVSF